MTERDTTARSRLVIALDFSSLDEARALAASVQPWFKTAKVGLELFATAGPAAVRALRADGFDVFVDLKLHDIPETTRRAAAAIARLGAAYATVHATGGADMLAAAAAGFTSGSAVSDRAGGTVGLGVTVLTSSEVSSPAVFEQTVRFIDGSGLGGVVCAATEVQHVRRMAPRLLTVVPGIRPAELASDDQVRTATPEFAIAQGADLLVVGRPITLAPDPVAASRQLAGAFEGAL